MEASPCLRPSFETAASRPPQDEVGICRVSTEDYSSVLLTEPDMRARIRLFGSIDQNASDSWVDTCGWLSSFQRVVSEAIRPVNQDGG